MSNVTKTMPVSFFFRSFPLVPAAHVPTGIKPATAKQLAELAANGASYDKGDAEYTDTNGSKHKLASACRKAVEAELTLPDLSAIANSPLLAHIVAEKVRTFAKEQYVDQFLPIGAHDWNTIEAAWLAAQESTGGFSACPFTDEQFATAQRVLDAYLVTVAPKLANASTKLITGKATKKAVEAVTSKGFGYSEQTLSKLSNRVLEAAATVDEGSDAEKVLAYCSQRVDALVKALAEAQATADDM